MRLTFEETLPGDPPPVLRRGRHAIYDDLVQQLMGAYPAWVRVASSVPEGCAIEGQMRNLKNALARAGGDDTREAVIKRGDAVYARFIPSSN